MAKFSRQMTSAVFAYVDDVAYVRTQGSDVIMRTRAYGESIPPSSEIFPPNYVMVVRVRTRTCGGSIKEFLCL